MMVTRLQCLNLLLHIFGPFDPLLDFLFIPKVGLAGECFVQAGLEVLIAKRVILAQVQELFRRLRFSSGPWWSGSTGKSPL